MTKLYAVSGTIEVPDHIDVEELVCDVEEHLDNIYEVKAELDQIDLIDECED